ncbi:hypothetical protein MRX96_057749 [Rhipicephalus microplus]
MAEFSLTPEMIAWSGHKRPRGWDCDCVLAVRRATSSRQLTATARPERLGHDMTIGCHNCFYYENLAQASRHGSLHSCGVTTLLPTWDTTAISLFQRTTVASSKA